MKRLLALVAGGLGIGALLRLRRRTPVPLPPASSLADELREKLAASRAAETEASETVPPSLVTDLEARRREVHERARGSIDELGKPNDA